MSAERQFKGVWVPAALWEASELSLEERAFLAEIHSLSTDKMGCFKSNPAFEKWCGLGTRRIQQILSELETKQLIARTQEQHGDMMMRVLRLTPRGEIYCMGGRNILHTPHEENFTHSKHISINTQNTREPNEISEAFSKIISELKTTHTMLTQVSKMLRTTPLETSTLLNAFIDEMIAKGDTSRPYKDYRAHFVSWAKHNHNNPSKNAKQEPPQKERRRV